MIQQQKNPRWTKSSCIFGEKSLPIGSIFGLSEHGIEILRICTSRRGWWPTLWGVFNWNPNLLIKKVDGICSYQIIFSYQLVTMYNIFWILNSPCLAKWNFYRICPMSWRYFDDRFPGRLDSQVVPLWAPAAPSAPMAVVKRVPGLGPREAPYMEPSWGFWGMTITLPETNIAPENGGFQ